jgi:hypothetical protein
LGTEYLLLPGKYVPGNPEKPFAERVPAAKPPGDGATLWKMKTTLPRAWIVHQVEVLPSLPPQLNIDALDARAVAVLFPKDLITERQTARNFATSAVVETDDTAEFSSITEASAAEIEREDCKIVLSEPTRVELDATLVRPGLVVLTDTFAPGWVAYLRSADESPAVQREVHIHRTNRVFRGVVVPAGRHLLRFEYQPVSFYLGAAVSALSWTALTMVMIVGVFRRRKIAANP